MRKQHDSTVTIFYALGANLLIAVAKSVAAWITSSTSMLAEAVHSFADCGNQGLLLLGMKSSEKPPNAEYPLGHGRAIYFWSFIVALMLFSMGGMFSIYEGFHKIDHEELPSSPAIAFGVLAISLVAESVSLWKCLTQVNALRGEMSLWRWFRSTRRSELLVVLGEDVAATLGLAFAMLALAATMITGNPVFDAIGSLAIGVLLLVVAVFIGVEVKALLVGQSADPGTREGLQRFLAARPEVAEVLHLITLQNGEDLVVAVKARMRETASATALVEAINRCEAATRAAFPEVRWLFFEPDVRD